MRRRSRGKDPLVAVAVGVGRSGEVAAVYNGSDGNATMALYQRLADLGPIGLVALNIFRAQKTSSRAKVYRGGTGGQSYKSMAYGRKAFSIETLCKVLGEHAAALNIRWGWAIDPTQAVHKFILYVDLPTGQVSWHTDQRGTGPGYPGNWDGVRGEAPNRICAWVAQVLEGKANGDR